MVSRANVSRVVAMLAVSALLLACEPTQSEEHLGTRIAVFDVPQGVDQIDAHAVDINSRTGSHIDVVAVVDDDEQLLHTIVPGTRPLSYQIVDGLLYYLAEDEKERDDLWTLHVVEMYEGAIYNTGISVRRSFMVDPSGRFLAYDAGCDPVDWRGTTLHRPEPALHEFDGGESRAYSISDQLQTAYVNGAVIDFQFDGSGFGLEFWAEGGTLASAYIDLTTKEISFGER
jgi:hypothetical protein